MAQNVQNVTLALTLPISCHICLGKVRHPVICANHHVFCSSCLDMWLKKNNQCPACRVPITPDNPCRDIIGGTSENENNLSHSVRKHLRKTRLELLQKEYEDEIETLIKENEELKRAKLKLEERLNRIADPITESSSCHCENRRAEDQSRVCDELLEDWNNKLEMVNTANRKVTEDNDKLKEENRRLKNENIEFVRENLRLKNEVELRSPQKFGRFTVAALQAKVDQYEREMSRLKKALERSDQYIEELEAQIVQLKRPPEDKQVEKAQCGNTALIEEPAGRDAASHVCQDISTAKLLPKHSHDNGIYADDSNSLCPIATRLKETHSKTDILTKLKNGLHTATWSGEEQTSLGNDSPRKNSMSLSQDFGSPSSSLPFSSLKLNTPDCKTNSFNKTNLKKPLTYLRKLVFDDLPQRQERGKLPSSGSEGTTQPGHPNAVFSNFCNINGNSQNSHKVDRSLQEDKSLSRLYTSAGEELHQPDASHENPANLNSHNVTVDSTMENASSHLGSQESCGPHQTLNCINHFQSASSAHICKSEKSVMPHPELSTETQLSSGLNLLSPSAAASEEQAQLFMAHSSIDQYNIDFSDSSLSGVLPCSSFPLEEEVSPQRPDSSELLLSGHFTEPACMTSSLPQTYNGSPPAKRKLMNLCTNSPSKSSKH